MASIFIKIEAADSTPLSYRKMLKSLQSFEFPDEIKHGRALTFTNEKIKINLMRVSLDTMQRVKADTREENGRLIIPSKFNYE